MPEIFGSKLKKGAAQNETSYVERLKTFNKEEMSAMFSYG